MITNKFKRSAILAGLFFCLLGIWSCSSEQRGDVCFIEGNTMGSKYHLKIVGNGNPHQIKPAVDSLLLLFNQAFSTYDTNSLLSLFNRNQYNFGGQDTRYSEDQRRWVLHVIYRSFDVFTASGGAFDPGAGSIFSAWGFSDHKPKKVPSVAYIDSCLQFGSMKYLELVNGIPVKKDARLTLNFNAIAPGYAADLVAELLEGMGFEHFMVEISGEVHTKGKNQNHEPWNIGINVPDPKSASDDVQQMLTLSDMSLATSGNYRNFFVENGQTYAHTVDPRTGYPAKNQLLSATIVTRNCISADAWATACMVLGKEKCMDLVRKDTSLKVFLLFSKDGKIESEYSPNLKTHF